MFFRAYYNTKKGENQMQQNNILIGQYVIKEEKGFYEVIDIETKETIMRYER